jgi:hypothetical protein
MITRTKAVTLVLWALVGVPFCIALATYLGAPTIGEGSNVNLALVVWIALVVSGIWSGLRGLLAVFTARLWVRATIGALYVAAAYPLILSISFISAMASGPR